MGKVLRFERKPTKAKAIVTSSRDVETYQEKQERMARERRKANKKVLHDYRMKRT